MVSKVIEKYTKKMSSLRPVLILTFELSLVKLQCFKVENLQIHYFLILLDQPV